MSGGEAPEGKPPGAADATAEMLARGLAAGAGASGMVGAAWAPPAAEALAEAFPGLRVVALAGRGGMGVVYRAEQTRLGRPVAVKILPPGGTPDPVARERFEREARVLSGLNHSHVLQIYDFGALPDGTLYLVTEWADGGDLAKLLAGRPQPLETVCELVAQISAALEAAHAKGVVHRDLKPANVLVRADGRLALADFGLAQARGAGFTTTLTMSGAIFGTFEYMAPEQMNPDGVVTSATDIYALGVMTYQMLTGRVPRGVFLRPSKLVGTPLAVDAVLDAAMATEPELRPRGAGDFARALARAAARPGRRSRLPWILGAGVLAVGAALWAVKRGEPARVEVAAEPVPSMMPTPSMAPTPTLMVMPTPAPTPEPTPVVVASPTSAPVTTLAPTPTVTPEPTALPWTWLLPDVRPAQHATNGGWTMRGGELVSDATICTLRLPVQVAADFRYDVAVEFTRTGGRNSVGVFLPTRAGTGVFELDAWDAGLGGIQMINDQDMRAHGEHFPAPLRNGEKQQLILQVRGQQITAVWNGTTRRTWNLGGRRFSNNWVWEAGTEMRLGLCSWKSPTVFHRVAYRAATD